MDVGKVQTQHLNFGSSLYREGYLDEQFTQLQRLADESQPGFVLENISIFFNDSDRILHDLTHTLDRPVPDFNQVADMIQTLKGSSSSVGAKKVKNVCTAFKTYCGEQNLQGLGAVDVNHYLLKLFPNCEPLFWFDSNRQRLQVKQDYAAVRSKLDTLLTMQQQIKTAGGVVPVIE